MAFKSAKEFLEALASGKKIRLKSWGKIHYIYLSGDEIFCSDGAISTGMIDVRTWQNYELYQEDKSITLCQVYYQSKTKDGSLNPATIRGELYKTKDDFINCFPGKMKESDFEFIHLVPITIPNEAFIK